MNREVEKISEQLGQKTILLPKDTISDCYAVYSKDEFETVDDALLVEGKGYKHRLYLYKKNPNSSSYKTLSFITLNAGTSTHISQDEQIDEFLKIAGYEYGAIEVFSIFTLRTLDTIDAVSEDAILDVVRCDLSKNDVVLAYGKDIQRTEKYKDLSDEDLLKINLVKSIKVRELLEFILKEKREGKIFSYEDGKLTEFITP